MFFNCWVSNFYSSYSSVNVCLEISFWLSLIHLFNMLWREGNWQILAVIKLLLCNVMLVLVATRWMSSGVEIWDSSNF